MNPTLHFNIKADRLCWQLIYTFADKIPKTLPPRQITKISEADVYVITFVLTFKCLPLLNTESNTENYLSLL